MPYTIKHRDRNAWVKNEQKGPNDPARYGAEADAVLFESREKATITAYGFEEVTMGAKETAIEIAKTVVVIALFGGIAFVLMI